MTEMELIEKIETAKGILEEIHAAENIDARGREEALEEIALKADDLGRDIRVRRERAAKTVE